MHICIDLFQISITAVYPPSCIYILGNRIPSCFMLCSILYIGTPLLYLISIRKDTRLTDAGDLGNSVTGPVALIIVPLSFFWQLRQAYTGILWMISFCCAGIITSSSFSSTRTWCSLPPHVGQSLFSRSWSRYHFQYLLAGYPSSIFSFYDVYYWLLYKMRLK